MQDLTSLSDLDLIDRYRNSHDEKYVLQLLQRYGYIPAVICMNKSGSLSRSKQLVEEIIIKVKKKLKQSRIKSFEELILKESKDLFQ